MATRKISTKLAIEGESEYRSAMTRINGEIKTLQSSLKLTESQYQTNANSMQALTAKGEALNNLYQAQQTKVNQLKAALENAKSALSNYQTQNENLRSKLEANNTALSNLDDQTKKAAEQWAKYQSQVTKNTEELEKLKKSSGDTSEEQAKLEEKIEKAREAMDKLSEKTGGTAEEYGKLIVENQSLTAEMSSTESKMAAAEQGVNSWQNQLNNAEIRLNDLDAELKLNGEYLDEAKNSSDGCATSIDRFGDRVQASADSAGQLRDALAAAGVIAALEKTAEALEACVESAAEFEATMSGVEAISGATGEEMEALNAKAKELGATTKFTADEAGQAMGYMAMAGWDAQQMLDGMDGVMSLAAASGEDLAMVSDIVTDSLTGFGLTAADTGRFADVLAAAAANANTNVSMMGETFKYAAPLAGALGYDVEDVAVATGLMANSGIKASEAGTTLRNIFTRLAKPTKESADAMDALGISLTDDQGNMLTFMEVMERMRGSFAGLTEEQKTFYAAELAGQRGMSGLLAVVNASETDFNKLSAAISNSSGAAKEMADIKMDNLTGQVTLMESAFDAVKIAIGEQLTPALTDLASAATDGLSWLATTITDSTALVPLLGGVTTALAVLTGGIVGYTAVTKLAEAATALFTAVMESNPIFLAATAVAALAAGIAVLVTTMDDGTPKLKDLTTAAQDVDKTISEGKKSVDDTVASTEAAASVAEMYVSRLEELEATGLKTRQEQDEYHRILQLLCETVPELTEYIDLETDSIEGGTQALRDQIEAMKDHAIQEAMQEQLTELYKKHAAVLVEQEKNELALSDAQTKRANAERQRNEAIERTNQLYSEAETKAAKMTEETGRLYTANEFLTQEYWDLCDAIQNEFPNAINEANADIATQQKAIEDDKAAVAAATEEIDTYERAIRKMGATSDSIAQTVISGEMTKAEAAEYYGISVEAVEHAVKNYEAAQIKANAATDGAAESAQKAKKALDENDQAVLQVGLDALDAARSGGDLRKAYDDLKSALDKLDPVQDAELQKLVSTAMETLNLVATNQELVNALGSVPGAFDGIGESTLAFSQFLIDSGVTVDEFMNGVTSMRDTTINNFKAIADESGITAEEMGKALSQNLETMTQWGSDLKTLWAQAYADQDTAVLEYINYLAQMGPSYASAVHEFANGGYNELATQAATYADIGAMSAQYTADGIYMNSYLAGEAAADMGNQVAAGLENIEGWTTAGADGVTQFSNAVEGGAEGAAGAVTTVTEAIAQRLAVIEDDFKTYGDNVDTGLQIGIAENAEKPAKAAEDMVDDVTKRTKAKAEIKSPSGVFKDIGKNLDEGLREGITANQRPVISAVEGMVSDISSRMRDGGSGAVTAFTAQFDAIKARTASILSGLQSTVSSYTAGLPNQMYSVGNQMIWGMIDGLNNASGWLYWTIGNIVNDAIITARNAADVNSPSRKTRAIFESVGEGMIVGIENRSQEINRKMQEVVDNALDVDTRNNIPETMLRVNDRDLTSSETAVGRQVMSGGETRNVTVGDINITVNDAKDLDERALADVVEERIMHHIEQKEAGLK